MDVAVLLFGPAAAAAGLSKVTVRAGPNPTVASLAPLLRDACPAIAPMLPGLRFARNGEFARPDEIVRQGDEIALIGLVSGG
ncbi:MAG: MoaD/ThiS family protein [Phycisphaerales bacterium]|nr:MoaD/ThiS family protein [Phycisphaerales bacterium]